MRARFLVLLLPAVFIAAGCGGGSGGGSSSAGTPASGGNSSHLVTQVGKVSVTVNGTTIDATTNVTEGGGKAGERLSLRYGLVDAVSGVRASQQEQLAAKYTTTSTVEKKSVNISFRKPSTPTDYLLHVVLYGPDGSYLASADSDVFTVH